MLKGGTLIDPHNEKTYDADVHIKDGKIHEIGRFEKPESCEIIDCVGKVITHGFCDLHVHFREPGREDKETLKLDHWLLWLEDLQESVSCLILIHR